MLGEPRQDLFEPLSLEGSPAEETFGLSDGEIPVSELTIILFSFIFIFLI